MTAAVWELPICANGILYRRRNRRAFGRTGMAGVLPTYKRPLDIQDSYRIPASRYYEVFGYNLTSLIFSGLKQLLAWEGSCYGMSILAAAQYNGQLDLTVLFPSSGQGLYQFGQSGIATAGGEQYFQIAENPDAVATVERAHLIQYSQEIKKAEVFGWDKSYSQLLAYLNEENSRPVADFSFQRHGWAYSGDRYD